MHMRGMIKKEVCLTANASVCDNVGQRCDWQGDECDLSCCPFKNKYKSVVSLDVFLPCAQNVALLLNLCHHPIHQHQYHHHHSASTMPRR